MINEDRRTYVHGRHTMELKCDRCSYITSFPGNLERHRRVPVTGPVHQCSLCDFTGCVKKNVAKHVKENHLLEPERPQYNCDWCSYSTDLPANLSVHVRQLRTHPVLECSVPKCNYKSCFGSSMWRHKRLCHGIYTNKDETVLKYPDDFNPESTSNKNMDIQPRCESSIEEFEGCEMKLRNDQDKSMKLDKQEYSVATLVQSKKGKKIYRCSRCNYSTTFRLNLLIHARQQRTHPVLECPVDECNFKSCFKTGISLHKKRFHKMQNKRKIGLKYPDVFSPELTSNQYPDFRTTINSSIEKLEDNSETKLENDQVSSSKCFIVESSVGILGQDKQERPYRCNRCSYSTNLLGNLGGHTHQRKGQPVLECPVPKCNYKSCFRKGMTIHKRQVHGMHNKPKIFFKHPEWTSNQNPDIRTAINSSNEKLEASSETKLETDQVNSIKFFEMGSSVGLLGQEKQQKTYQCDRCSFSANLATNLSVHVRQRRTHPVLECSVLKCNYKSCFRLGMSKHERQVHGVNAKPEKIHLDSKLYRCDRCSFATGSSANLAIHVKQRRGQPVLECSLPKCDYKSCFKVGMIRHEKKVHGVLNQLDQNQLKSKLDKRQYKCDSCSYSANLPNNLAIHVRQRRGEPVLECSIPECNFKSCFKLGMIRHEKNAHVIPTQLDQFHLKPRLDGCLYRCERCSYSTNLGRSLALHIRQRRGKPVSECSVPECTYKSCFRLGMIRHEKNVHGICKNLRTYLYPRDGFNPESDQNSDIKSGCDSIAGRFEGIKESGLKNRYVKSLKLFNVKSSIGIWCQDNQEKQYRCDRCNYSTNLLANLSIHARQRRGRPVLQCSVPNCNYKSCFKPGMWKHKREYHGIHKKQEAALISPGRLNEESTSNQNPDIHPVFDPSIKKFEATGKTKLENKRVKSMNSFNCESSIGILGQGKKEKTYLCDQCSYATNFRPNLELHVRQRRSHPVLECPVSNCSYKACFNASMVRHSKQSHEMFNKPKIVPQISHSLNPKTEDNLVEFSSREGSLNTLNDVKIYKCDKCSFSTTSRGSISIHLRRRVNQPVSICSEPGCSYTCCFKLSMVKHKNMNHPQRKTLRIKTKRFLPNSNKFKKLSCPFCNYMCNLKSTLSIHLKLHQAFSKNTKLSQSLISFGKENKYSCGRCSFSTANPRNMLVHTKCQTKYPVLKCPYPKCHYTSCFRVGVTKHGRRVHGVDYKEAVPNHGIFKVRSSPALSLQKSGLQLTKLQDQIKEFKCDRCSYSTNRHGDLYIHLRQRGKQPILSCPVQGCSYKSCFKLGLARHKNRAHGRGLLVKNPACVTRSVQRHTFACPFCNYTCRLKSVLSIHLSRHRTIAGQKRLTRTPKTETDALFRTDTTAIKEEERIYFSCPYCDYSSDCRVEVGNHVKTHRREDIIFSCQFCNFQANFLGVIEKHEKRHSKERSLGCELCGKVFAVHENLLRHELLHRNKSFLRGKGLKLKKFG